MNFSRSPSGSVEEGKIITIKLKPATGYQCSSTGIVTITKEGGGAPTLMSVPGSGITGWKLVFQIPVDNVIVTFTGGVVLL